MLMFEWILVLLLAAVILTNLARDRGCGSHLPAIHSADPNRAGARIGAVRGAGAARRRL